MKKRLSLLVMSGLFIAGSFVTPVGAQSGGVTLVSVVEFPNYSMTDVTSYVDPVAGTEYAIAGHESGIFIVDLADPRFPTITTHITTHDGYDAKTFEHYLYAVSGSGSLEIPILDISDTANPVESGFLNSAHNLFIDPRGYMVSTGGGGPSRIESLIVDPTSPEHVAVYDTTNGHDITLVGNRLYDFRGGKTVIYDVTDIANPQVLGEIDPPFISFHHSGWPTDDGSFLFITDEFALPESPDITVWDITDPQNPEHVASIQDTAATAHNIQIIGTLAFVSYYAAGFRVYDIVDPSRPDLVGEYDTDSGVINVFSGAFGVDAFLPSGHVLVSGTTGSTGTLHIFSVDGFTTVGVDDSPTAATTLNIAIFPNPSGSHRTISFDGAGDSSVEVFDVLGRVVYRRHLGLVTGRQSFAWDGPYIPAGTYIVKVRSGAKLQTVPTVVN